MDLINPLLKGVIKSIFPLYYKTLSRNWPWYQSTVLFYCVFGYLIRKKKSHLPLKTILSPLSLYFYILWSCDHQKEGICMSHLEIIVVCAHGSLCTSQRSEISSNLKERAKTRNRVNLVHTTAFFWRSTVVTITSVVSTWRFLPIYYSERGWRSAEATVEKRDVLYCQRKTSMQDKMATMDGISSWLWVNLHVVHVYQGCKRAQVGCLMCTYLVMCCTDPYSSAVVRSELLFPPIHKMNSLTLETEKFWHSFIKNSQITDFASHSLFCLIYYYLLFFFKPLFPPLSLLSPFGGRFRENSPIHWKWSATVVEN